MHDNVIDYLKNFDRRPASFRDMKKNTVQGLVMNVERGAMPTAD